MNKKEYQDANPIAKGIHNERTDKKVFTILKPINKGEQKKLPND